MASPFNLNLQSMGVLPGQDQNPDNAPMMPGPWGQSAPTLTAPAPSSDQPIIKRKPLMVQAQSGQPRGSKNQKNNFLDDEAIQDKVEALQKSMPQSDNSDLEGQINNLKSESGGSWITPLLALSDAQNGTHMAESLKGFGGMSPTDRNAMIMKYQDEIQKRNNDRNKTLMSGLSAVLKKPESTTTIQNGDMSLGGLGGLAPTRLEALRIGAGKQFDSDKVLTGLEQTQNAFERARNLLDSKMPLAKQDVDLIQADIINGMQRSGQATVSTQQREMLNTMYDAVNKAQVYGGSLGDLRKAEPQIFEHITDKLNQVQKDSADQYEKRAESLRKNYTTSPFPGIAEMGNAKADAAKERTATWRNSTSKKITISNGKESHTLVNPSDQDLADAAKEGFKKVQ